MKSAKTDTELLSSYKKIYDKPFRGWGFSEILRAGSATESPLEWNYYDEILPRVRRAVTMLDMGTGGGEFLKSLAPLPHQTFATEGYQPNVAIARRRLGTLGVRVISRYADEKLPFESNY